MATSNPSPLPTVPEARKPDDFPAVRVEAPAVPEPSLTFTPHPRSLKESRVAGSHQHGFSRATLRAFLEAHIAPLFPHLRDELIGLIENTPDETDLFRTIRFFRLLEYRTDLRVDVIRKATKNTICTQCHQGEWVHSDTAGYGQLQCTGCGLVVTDTTPVMLFSSNMSGLGGTSVGCANNRAGDGEGETQSSTSSSDYGMTDERDNFRKAWNAVHGYQKPKLPADLFERLDEYFLAQGRKSGADIRAQPVIMNMYGEQAKEGTSVEAMHAALKVLQVPLYSDEFYLRNSYWGWPYPDFTSIKERVFRNYERTRAVYPRCKGARESPLNSFYWLYQEIRAAGGDAPVHLFSATYITTDKIRRYHEMIRQQMCTLASEDGDIPIAFFPLD